MNNNWETEWDRTFDHYLHKLLNLPFDYRLGISEDIKCFIRNLIADERKAAVAEYVVEAKRSINEFMKDLRESPGIWSPPDIT